MKKSNSKKTVSTNEKTNKSKNPQDGFSKSFSSEMLLQQAIAGLLTRMPDITGVQILQGTQELGKDLVFYVKGGFGEQILCACVVKNSKISGAVGDNSGARTVFQQAEQAFDSVHTDSFGTDIRVERVYVVTPFDLPPATITSIKGKLRERAGQVVFIGGTTLFDLFKQHWSDYFADEAEIIEQHLNYTKSIYETESPIVSLANQYNIGDVTNYSKKIHVSQTLYRKINKYVLGHILTRPIFPENLQLLILTEPQIIRDRLNELRVAVTYLHKWGYCSDNEKDGIYQLADIISDTFTKYLKKKEERDSLRLVLKERDTSKEAIRKLLQNIEKFEGEMNQAFAEVNSEIAVLHQKRQEILAKVNENLTTLKLPSFKNATNTVELLSSPILSQALILDDCAQAAPENLFIFKEGIKLNFPKDILSHWHSHLMIVGAPGYGKTSFCRWNALQDTESFNSGSSNIIPVYIPLSQLSSKPISTFEDTFLSKLGKSALIKSTDINSRIKVRIYLDGLDEIASQDRRREIIELAKSVVQGDDKYQIILTARDYIYARWLDWLPRLSLGGFENKDIRELVDGWLGQDTESNKLFWEQLNATTVLTHLMQTPLLATLIIMVFRQTGKLPESKARLYEIFINLLSGGWDLAKRVLRESKFGERIKVQVLGTLASYLQDNRRREFNSQDLKKAMSSTLSGSILDDWELLKEELISDGLITRSGDLLLFSHHSFQEFLTAKDMMSSPQPTRANRILEAYIWGDDWWKEVISFYISLSSNPAEVMEWLTKQLNYFRSLGYLTLSAPQIEYLKVAFSDAFPEYPKDLILRLK